LSPERVEELKAALERFNGILAVPRKWGRKALKKTIEDFLDVPPIVPIPHTQINVEGST
jgi:hypothetical protein